MDEIQMRKLECWSTRYFEMVAMLLFFTAVVKLMSLFGSKTTYIYNPDPLFLEFQSIYFILGAGFMEIVFASCLFLIRSRKTKTLLTLWWKHIISVTTYFL